MNDVQAIISRQLGAPLGRWGCDSVLKRLVVGEGESFLGVEAGAGGGTPDPPLFACRFAEAPSHRHLLALANEDGVVAIQDTSRVVSDISHSPLEGFQCHVNAVFDLAWAPGELKLVTVSGDHSACLWDVASGTPRRLLQFVQHTRSVKTAVFRPSDAAVFATGARDGNILLWDVRCSPHVPASSLVNKPDNFLLNCHAPFLPKTPGSRRQPRLSNNITGLVFQDAVNIISSGENDGNIKVWDLRKNYNIYKKDPLPKHSIPYCGSSTKNGYSNLIVDDARVRLYASGMDSVIYCFNVATYNTLPEQRYVGHESGTFYIKTSLSPDGRYLVSGSSDRNAYIWNVKSSEPIVRLVGHTAEVTCATWCQVGETKIVTCSDDARHKIWRIGKETFAKDEELMLRGRAEVVPRVDASRYTQWVSADRTPNSIKRRQQNITPSSCSAKRPRNGSEVAAKVKKTKRCLTDMLNATRLDKDEGEPKKIKYDVPTNENQDPELQPSGSKRTREDNTWEGSPSSKKLCAACPSTSCDFPPASTSSWTFQSPKKVGGADSFITPTKYYERTSPKLLSPKRSPRVTVATFSSPTVDLPNYVLDGEAPHLRLMSPMKKKQETPNWLAVMVREKKGKLLNDVAEKPTAVQTPLSPKAENVSARRNSATLERTPKRNSQKSTLLKYFNVVIDKPK